VLEETEGQVHLVWDQATGHTFRKVIEWPGKCDRVETYLLPVCSPEPNPMEDLWRAFKEQAASQTAGGLSQLRRFLWSTLDPIR
jgi:hypothetical protein